MGLLNWLENAGDKYLDRGVNGALAGVPPGLLNTAQTGIGPQPDGVAPMMTPQDRHNLRMNYLMHLGQGIAQGSPAAHLDEFRNDAIQSAVMGQQLQQQQQMRAAVSGALAPGPPPMQAAPVLGGAAPPIAPPNGASAAPGVAAPVMGGAPPVAANAAPAPPPTANPVEMARAKAQQYELAAARVAPFDPKNAKIFSDIAAEIRKQIPTDKDVAETENFKTLAEKNTGETANLPSVRAKNNADAAKTEQDTKALELKYYSQRAQDPTMNQDSWKKLYDSASPGLQAQMSPMFSPNAAAALQKMGVDPNEIAREDAAQNKPEAQVLLRENYGKSFAKLQSAGLLKPGDASNMDKTIAAFQAAPDSLISPAEKAVAIGYLGSNPTIASQGTVANIRVEGLQNSRMYPVIDKDTGNELMVSATEMVENPGKYAPAGVGSTGMQAGERFKTIQSNIEDVRKAVNQMGELPTGARIALAQAMSSTDPHSAVQTLIASAAGKALTQPQRDFLNYITILAESGNALAKMSGIPGNENTLAAVQALLPSAKDMDKKYMLSKLDSFQGLVTGLSKGVPKVLNNSATPAPSDNHKKLLDLISNLPSYGQ